MQKVLPGTVRVKRDGTFVEMTNKGWKKSSHTFPNISAVIKLYKGHKAMKLLYDTDKTFLKGQLSPEGREQGARIAILPNGEKLEKAYSLFSSQLQIHDQDSHDHWDVLYQNKGGTWSYVYTLTKQTNHRARKYRKVQEFAKVYDSLLTSVSRRLSSDIMAITLYTLLKTKMRVGNEIYFKAHGHKGLTTLEKNNVSIKGRMVSFSFIGKDGVPIEISQRFPRPYINALKPLLKGTGYIFKIHNHCVHERDFLQAFKEYCGKEFYPHIVRSHFATTEVQKFMKGRRSWKKEDVHHLYSYIAHTLCHKKFNKKTSQWDDSFSVTVKSYIQPELVEKITAKMKK